MGTTPETIPVPVAASPDVYIKVINQGWYVAEFDVSYTDYFGRRWSQYSGHIIKESNRSLPVPAWSTDVIVQVREWWGFGWKTIVTKRYPILGENRCYKVWGTTLSPQYIEFPCPLL